MSFPVVQLAIIPKEFMGMRGPFYIPEAHLKFPESMICSFCVSFTILSCFHRYDMFLLPLSWFAILKISVSREL